MFSHQGLGLRRTIARQFLVRSQKATVIFPSLTFSYPEDVDFTDVFVTSRKQINTQERYSSKYGVVNDMFDRRFSSKPYAEAEDHKGFQMRKKSLEKVVVVSTR